MEYRIVKTDELYHYGVKGMKWGVRHDPERSGGRQRKGMSTAKKVAIGVGIAAAAAGISYVAVTKHNNKVARAAVKRVLAHRGGRPINVSRGPTHTTFSPAENGLVNVHRNTPRKLTGHSGLVTRAGAARHRYQFYSRKAQSAPITWDYMKNRGASRRVFEEKANSAGEELLKAHKNGGYVSLNRRSSIPRLRRTKRVLGK